jgi:squalene-associated FAD-dependent desaturase
MRIVVVGGGLAGLAAALELSAEGHAVTVLEARPKLGGAVQTLPAREGDPEPPPDNGQHIALNCFRSYLRFLGEIGSLESMRWMRLSLPVVGEDGSVARIAPEAIALLRYRHISFRDRLAVALALRAVGKLDPASHDDETFADVLRRLGLSQPAIDRFWDVFIRPALNLGSEEVAASAAIFTVQTALLADKRSSDVVLPAAPLGEMHGEAAGRTLEAHGVVVRTDARVAALEDDAAVLADGERFEGEAFVVAVPPYESARLLGEPEPALEDSPIVSVHLLFDRPIFRFPLAALLGSRAHWIFDRGRLTGREPGRGQYLTVVSSGAPELLEIRGRALVETIAGEVTGRLGRAQLLWSRVSREPAATVALRPGTAALRPGPETTRPNVVRAGAWTATGWPATMEGAVRSGRIAAARLLGSAKLVIA